MKRLGHILLVLLAVVTVTAAAGLWLFRGYVDAAVNYTHAAPAVKSLGDQSKLNLLGQRYYYASAPSIVDKPAIQKDCAAVADEGLLGCYTGRIYLLDVTQPEFRSEMTVTAAHEMLHAAYDGLSKPERKRVDALLSAEIDRRKDAKLNERLNKYHDKASQLDEAFAILGSETSSALLQPALAREFDKYFTDREAVVAINTKFQAAFDGFESQIDSLNQQLTQRKQQLDELLAEGEVGAYNAQVGPYNQLVKQHNDLVVQYNDLGQRFNKAIGN